MIVAPITESTHLWLEIPQSKQQQAWEQSQSFSTASCCWNAYLNRLSLNAFLPWLRAEHAFDANISPNLATLPSFWEVVNGTAITFQDMRLVLIPSDAIDLSELRVPQEWVDIPSWAADYYLAVQVNPEEDWVRVWGYTTHAQLKNQGTYDPSDRSYSLDGEDLIADLSILWVARQLCSEEVTRTEVPPLPKLSSAQSKNLLARLGNSKVLLPRLEVPFTTWGALLEHGGWRQRLYELRQGISQQWSVIEWMQLGISDVAKTTGWQKIQVQMPYIGARGPKQASTLFALVKELTIDEKKYELRIEPKGQLENRTWRFELRNVNYGEMIPSGFKLKLFTEDLQPFPGNQAIAKTSVERLYVDVALGEPEEGLVWEIEPVPENFEREILIF